MILALGVLSGPAFAQDWAVRSGDVPLNAVEARALTAGTTLTFYDDGQSRYSADGRYVWVYSAANGGGQAMGIYSVRQDGAVCIDFDNGRSRCDLYVRSGDRLVLITEDGQRYPVRP